jgi:hypothetical protein
MASTIHLNHCSTTPPDGSVLEAMLPFYREKSGIDMRHAPRELQEAAFERGLIPYIPSEPEPSL